MPDADQQVVYWRLKSDHESGLTSLQISRDGGSDWSHICSYRISLDFDANLLRQTLTIAKMFLAVLNIRLERHPSNFPTEMMQGFAAVWAGIEKKEDEW